MEDRQFYKQSIQPILHELKTVDVKINDLQELAKKYAPISKKVTDILLNWIPKLDNKVAQAVIARQLAASKVAYDGNILTKLFEEEPFEDLRWAIANTLACTNAQNIEEWLIKTAKDPIYGKDREMLMIAIGKLVLGSTANEVLVSLFDEFPGHVASGLSYSGNQKELDFLEQQLSRTDIKDWEKREIQKSINKIKKRLGA